MWLEVSSRIWTHECTLLMILTGYNRFDIFDLKITRKRDEPVEWR